MHKILSPFINVLLPPRCVCCGKIVSEHGNLCHICFNNIQFISQPYCSVCGVPFEFLDQGMELKNNLDPKKLVCGRCLEKPPIFSNARSAIKYNQQSKKLVLSLKYFDRTDTASAFAKWIITCGQDIIDKSDLIIPVPMHKTRLINRKYNQASLLANKIAEKTNKEISHTILIRKKRTLPQKQGREKRAQNVKNAFEVKNRNNIKNKKILLIDDVITSGATINECSKELIKNGANNVFALSLARA